MMIMNISTLKNTKNTKNCTKLETVSKQTNRPVIIDDLDTQQTGDETKAFSKSYFNYKKN